MLDICAVVIQSWKWGDGAVAARREAGVPFGGPAGWDGGVWGSVIMQASKDEHTLSRYRYHTKLIAKNGEDGRIKDQYGADADDLTLLVPIGTLIKERQSGRILFQFTEDGQEYMVAKWGRWWAGNIHFANAVQQYPNFALYGEPGQKKEILLELQMLGDVWLVGTPSVGKSSLINSCCATRSKTAEYHFTTLEPTIGICDQVENSFSIVDIPGLIWWASEGKWLWNEFLRHVLKSKVFALVADMSRYEQSFWELTTVIDEILLYIRQRFVGSTEFGDTIEHIELVVNNEMTSLAVGHDHQYIVFSCLATSANRTWKIFDKAIQILANKYDMVSDEEISQEFIKALCAHLQHHLDDRRWLQRDVADILANSFVVSAATHYGIHSWISTVSTLVHTLPLKTMTLLDTVAVEEDDHRKVIDRTSQEIDFLAEEWYIDPRTSKRVKVREIYDDEITRLVFTLPRGNDQAEHRFRQVMMKQKHLTEFERLGIVHGDILKIRSCYDGQEDKYVMYV